MRILILDDQKVLHEMAKRWFAQDHVVHTYSHEETVAVLAKEESFDVVYLDHNIGSPSYTGYDTAKFIAYELDKRHRPKRVVVHTNHPLAAPRMVQLLLDAGLDAIAERFKI